MSSCAQMICLALDPPRAITVHPGHPLGMQAFLGLPLSHWRQLQQLRLAGHPQGGDNDCQWRTSLVPTSLPVERVAAAPTAPHRLWT